jgi:hypothetical protein
MYIFIDLEQKLAILFMAITAGLGLKPIMIYIECHYWLGP